MPVPASKIPEYLAELVATPQPAEFRVRFLVSEMKRALKTTQDSDKAANLYTALGIAHALLNDQEKAVEHHEKACRLGRWDYVNPNNYAVTLNRFDRPADALGWFFVAAEAPHGHNTEVLANLAMGLSRVGAADDARSAFEEASRVASGPDDLPYLARAAAMLGFYEVALGYAARHLVAHCPALSGLAPVDVIAAAPEEMRASVLRQHQLAVAWHVTKRLGPLPALSSRLPPPRALAFDSPSDDLVFEWTRPMRARATLTELGGSAYE